MPWVALAALQHQGLLPLLLKPVCSSQSDDALKLMVSIDPTPSKQTAVKALLTQISLPTMQDYLNNLTAYNNRYYTSTTGQAASVWIKDTMAAVSRPAPTMLFISLLIHRRTIGRDQVPCQRRLRRLVHPQLDSKLHYCQDPGDQ